LASAKLVSELEFNVPFQHKYGYIRDGCQPNFAALNRGRHRYSAGRPSRWALAHILVHTDSPDGGSGPVNK